MKKFTYLIITLAFFTVFSIIYIRYDSFRQTYPKLESLHQKLTNIIQPNFYNSPLSDNLEIDTTYFLNQYKIKKFKMFLSDFAPRHPHGRLTSFLGGTNDSIFLFTSHGKSYMIYNIDNTPKVKRLKNN